MTEKLSQLADPNSPSLFKSWFGTGIVASISPELWVSLIVAVPTSFYTCLKIYGWFLDRKQKQKENSK